MEAAIVLLHHNAHTNTLVGHKKKQKPKVTLIKKVDNFFLYMQKERHLRTLGKNMNMAIK